MDKEKVVDMLEKLIEKVKEEEIIVEGFEEQSEQVDVSTYNSKSIEFFETGRFSITLNLYDENKRNYKEIISKLADNE